MRDPRWPFDPPRGCVQPAIAAVVAAAGLALTVAGIAAEATTNARRAVGLRLRSWLREGHRG